jgi:hypothetical protein
MAYSNRIVFRCVLLLALIIPAIADAQSNFEPGRSYAMAKEIQRDYIDQLALKGGAAGAAIQRMFAQGFRCRLLVAGELVPLAEPEWDCEKQPSGYPLPCDEMRVALPFRGHEAWTTHQAMLLHLDEITVKSAMVFCHPPLAVPVEYVAAREAAGASLHSYVESLELIGRANAAYEKLLLSGFHCGFESTQSSTTSRFDLVCTRAPSSVKFCGRARVVLSIRWPNDAQARDQLRSALPSSVVEGTRSGCDTPAILAGHDSPS